MLIRIEIDAATGERREIPYTPEEIADAEARTAAELAERAAATVDPVAKLAAFLSANPDVAALIGAPT
jgi:hypothetical protein